MATYKNHTSYIDFDTSEEGRFKILDSDGEYIDYFTDETQSDKEFIMEFLQKIDCAQHSPTAIIELVYEYTEAMTILINPLPRLRKAMYDIYGRDYINRIGNNYLIMPEN